MGIVLNTAVAHASSIVLELFGSPWPAYFNATLCKVLGKRTIKHYIVLFIWMYETRVLLPVLKQISSSALHRTQSQLY